VSLPPLMRRVAHYLTQARPPSTDPSSWLIPGTTVTQRPAHPTGDMLQPPILVLQVGELCSDPLEGSFQKLESGRVNILPRLLPAGTGLVAGLWSGRFPCLRIGNRRGWFGDDGVF